MHSATTFACEVSSHSPTAKVEPFSNPSRCRMQTDPRHRSIARHGRMQQAPESLNRCRRCDSSRESWQARSKFWEPRQAEPISLALGERLRTGGPKRKSPGPSPRRGTALVRPVPAVEIFTEPCRPHRPSPPQSCANLPALPRHGPPHPPASTRQPQVLG